MPLDHFVSQVHLKNFYSPELRNRMYAIRKSDLKAFMPDASSVCRIADGSTNSYLAEERAVEEFLKDIEPKYNEVLARIAAGDIDAECIYVVAGFTAYVASCSPAGMRIHAGPLKESVSETGRLLDNLGQMGAPPPELGGASLTELLDSGAVHVEVDHKYPQAMGIASILSRTSAFGNFQWDILLNRYDDSPFFTSDYPVAIEKTSAPRVLNRVVPLSPTLAVRLRPDISLDTTKVDFSFSGFGHRTRYPSRDEVSKINSLIVRCAESQVFFCANRPWVSRFVKKNAAYRIEPRTIRIPQNGGVLLWSSLTICKL